MSDVSVMLDEIEQMMETLEAGARDAGYERGVADAIDLMYQEAARSKHYVTISAFITRVQAELENG